MPKALVVHNTLNSVGGGERVCLAVIKALKEMGFRVTLATTEKTRWDFVERMIGWHIRPDAERYLTPFRLKGFGIYARLIAQLPALHERYDLIVNTHGDATPFFNHIVYMHFPTLLMLKYGPPTLKYKRSLLWRIYFEPYCVTQKLLYKRLRRWVVEGKTVILTNSRYSAKVIREELGLEANVVYPPVDVREFLKASVNDDREDVVIACGRFTPEKNFEFVIRVASRLPEVKFVIVGALSGKASKPYLDRLMRLKEKLGVKNVEFLVNLPRSDQVRLYSRAKVYMHTMVNEHFGIAVVEAMAAGLIPVVHRSGGPWLDIIEEGRYGFGYETLEEAVEAVRKALDAWSFMRKHVVESVARFSLERFMEGFSRIVERLINV